MPISGRSSGNLKFHIVNYTTKDTQVWGVHITRYGIPNYKSRVKKSGRLLGNVSWIHHLMTLSKCDNIIDAVAVTDETQERAGRLDQTS